MINRISPLLTDQYQFSMVYSYFAANQHMRSSAFEMFFRTNPFKGSYAVFAGLDRLLEFLVEFHFTEDELTYLKSIMPYATTEFFEYLKTLDYKQLTIRAPAEGTVVFSNEPLVIVEGPLGMCQLIETTLLVLVNYATLVCTNACRIRVANHPEFTTEKRANEDPKLLIQKMLKERNLLEFGLRRAQGPDGGMSASKYSIMGGFNGSSNVLQSMNLAVQAQGTIAHSYVLSFTESLDFYLKTEFASKYSDTLKCTFGRFAEMCLRWKSQLFSKTATPFSTILIPRNQDQVRIFGEYHGNEHELAAFAHFAFTQPSNFLALIDTYDTVNSGLMNFVIVTCALIEFNIASAGVRLDSGDLAYLSQQCRLVFDQMDIVLQQQYQNVTPNTEKCQYNSQFKNCKVCASNDLTEEVLIQLQSQGAKIDIFGIGTHLVTCKAQPALGGVYKLVEVDNVPRMKMTEELSKATLPCVKDVYRLFLTNGEPYADLIQQKNKPAPQIGQVITCVHPHDDLKRVMVKPSRVQKLHQTWLDQGKINYDHKIEGNKIILKHPNIHEVRQLVLEQVYMLRSDYKRYLNPGAYKVSVTIEMNQMIKQMALECKAVPLME